MICPVEIASDLSAWRAARVGDHAKHCGLLKGRGGAGMKVQEVILRAMAKKITWVAGRRDYRHQRPADAALAGALGRVWLRRVV